MWEMVSPLDTSTPRKWVLGRVVMNWRVWGEKHLTMPSAQPMKTNSSPTDKQLALQTKHRVSSAVKCNS